MKKLYQLVFDRFLFVPRAPESLALFRIILCLGCLSLSVVAYGYVFQVKTGLPWRPIGVFNLLDGPIDPESLQILFKVWIALLVLVLFGLFTRISTIFLFIVFTFMIGHPNNFGMVNHNSNMLIIVLFVMCFSRWGDVISLDQKIFKIKAKEKSWHYGWPLAMAILIAVFSMFTLGVQKFYFQGLNWALSDGFYISLFLNKSKPPLTQFILDSPVWFSMILAFFSLVVVELLAPLALLRKFSLVYPLIWASFHFTVTLTLGGHRMFWTQIFIYSAFYLVFFDTRISKFFRAQ